MLFSKCVYLGSEICFESNLNKGLTCFGFFETRNQILFRNVFCVVSTRPHPQNIHFKNTRKQDTIEYDERDQAGKH